MTRQEIDMTIHSLASSQGFYGRLIAGYYGDYEEILERLKARNLQEPLDVILALESLEE